MRTALAALVLAAACAHARMAADSIPPEQAANARVLVTGSRIARPFDPATGLPLTFDPVRIYGRDRLEQTGHADLRAALRDLDPSF